MEFNGSIDEREVWECVGQMAFTISNYNCSMCSKSFSTTTSLSFHYGMNHAAHSGSAYLEAVERFFSL